MEMRGVVAEVERAVELGQLAELLGAAPDQAVVAKVEGVLLSILLTQRVCVMG